MSNNFDILKKAKKEHCMCIYHYAGTMKYQICCHFSDQFVVDLGGKTCICRKWRLRGFYVALQWLLLIRDVTNQKKKICTPTYWKSTYMISYEVILNPINGPNLWVQVDLPTNEVSKLWEITWKTKKVWKKGPDKDENRQSCVNPFEPHKISKIETREKSTFRP